MSSPRPGYLKVRPMFTTAALCATPAGPDYDPHPHTATTPTAVAQFETRHGQWRGVCLGCLQRELDAIAWLDGQGRTIGLPPLQPTPVRARLDLAGAPETRAAIAAETTVADLQRIPPIAQTGLSIEYRRPDQLTGSVTA